MPGDTAGTLRPKGTMTWAVARQAVAIAPVLSPGPGGVMVRPAVKYPACSVGSGASRLWRLPP